MTGRTVAVIAVVLAGLLAGCAEEFDDESGALRPDPATAAPGTTAELPLLIARTLDASVEDVQARGFQAVGMLDAGGAPRASSSWDGRGDWTVCFQFPAPGLRDPNGEVILGMVAPDETCPGRVRGWEGSALNPLGVDMRSSRLVDVVDALAVQRTVSVLDARSGERTGLRRAQWNWVVCDTDDHPDGAVAKPPLDVRAAPTAQGCR